MIKILMTLTVTFWSVASFSGFRLSSLDSIDKMRGNGVGDSTIKFVLKDNSFTREEAELVYSFKENAFTEVDKRKEGHSLLTVVEFIVNREIDTFREESLLDSSDISKMSGVSIHELKNNSANYITFKSNLPIVIGSIDSDNELFAIPFNDIEQYPEIHKMISSIKQDGVDPSFISYQESFNFSKFIERSQVLTFYFPLDRGRSLIKSFTLTQLPKGTSFFVRKAMLSSIKSRVSEIPEICEKNGEKW